MINEKTTREQWIDAKLIAAGWTKIVDFSESLDLASLHKVAVCELPTDDGFADYVLYLHGKPYVIVEAKKISLNPQNVLQQAQRYAKTVRVGLGDYHGYKVPFAYATNGELVWFQDFRIELSRSRTVDGFHTPDALEELYATQTSTNALWLLQNPPDSSRLRPYQKEAIKAVEAAMAQSKRSMLVAMATGTGKTYTVASLIYRLLRSHTSKRILFLVDRKALAAQAVMEFAAYEAEGQLKFNQIYQVYSQKFKRNAFGDEEKFDFTALPNDYLTHPDGTEAFVYVCTIQRMQINLFGKEGMFSASGDYEPEDDADKIDIPIHAFDTIIADECHRGYTSHEISRWREVLDHFDGTKIGLTATPAAHTTSYFKDIVYRYGYEQAVKDGYLVDYDAIKIDSGVRLSGITIQEGDEVEQIDPETGAQQLDLIEDERHFEVSEVEHNVTAPDSNKKIIEEYAKYALAHEKDIGRFPKTLIFAANDLPHTSHADQLVDICRDVFGRGDAFVQKITGSATVDRPLQRIKEFRNRPEPHIVVTVDMLSTGVDIPSIEYIIFLRPVRSRILFEQMLGRGTRLCKNFPNGMGTSSKTHFTIFDCFGGTLLEAFRNSTGMTTGEPIPPTRTIEEIITALSNNSDVEYNTRCFIKRIQRINKEITQAGRDSLAKYIPNGDLGAYAQTFADKLRSDRGATLQTITDKDFIYLLTHYPKPDRLFIKAPGVIDTVVSEYLFRTTDGRELKPTEYIEQFEKYVKENPEHIAALEVVLEKPAAWSTAALRELRQKLAQAPERFTDDNLRKAYKYPLADIISMIKHAGKDEPLMSGKERVEKAIAKVMAGHSLTPQQEAWLVLIKKHLIENLTLEPDDFDAIPLFRDHGGSFGRINRDFDDKLMDYINQINAAIPEVYTYAV